MATKEAIDEPVETVDVLWHWIKEGWKYRRFGRILSKSEQARARAQVEREMDIIVGKDFCDYFAALSDVVRTAKDEGIAVGPARGSAAASLVCYLIRLTEVNPLNHPEMLVERFIDPNRDDLPDIDLDFEDERRDRVRQIMIEKYGADRVGNIGTFTRYRGKNAIDDVARVYSIPPFEVAQVKEFLVERSGGDSRFDASILDTVEMFPQVKAVFDRYPDLYRAVDLEGNYKSFGVHAAGLVIGNEDLWRYCATYTKNHVGKENKSVQVLSVDKYDGEHLGLMKLDALGLKTMGMIRIALDLVGMKLDDLYDISIHDPETLAAFERADVQGIFQFEGRTMKIVTEEMRPATFSDLAAVNAMSRPGPLHSGSTNDYLNIRHGRIPRPAELHPAVTRLTAETEGQIIYQEQILQICREVGNFPYTDMGKIRKVISSKQGEAAFQEMWDQFLEGALSNGTPKEDAAKIWQRMVTAGTYAFNAAHCISYSMLGLWSMWFKVHHPIAFYTAQLRKTDDAEKQVALLRDAMATKFGRNIKILPPLPGRSGVSWTPDEGGIRAGYAQIPGIGLGTAQRIVDAEVPVKEWADLENIRGIGAKTIEKIQAFADDPDPFEILKLKDDEDAIIASIRRGELPGVPEPTAKIEDVPYEAKAWKGVMAGRLRDRVLQDLFENHRGRTGEELDPMTVSHPELKDSMTLYLEDTSGPITAKVSRFAYRAIKEILWSAKLKTDWLVFSAEKRASFGRTVYIKSVWCIEPD